MIFYLLDLVGTFAFAFAGAQLALKHHVNMLGIIILASLMAVGGGTIREVLLQQTPFYFYDYAYLLAILVGIFLALITFKHRTRLASLLLLADSLGTIIFAATGARAATEAGLGLPAIIVFACLTAFGGGLLSDLLLKQKPRIFYSALPLFPSLMLAVFYWLYGDAMHQPWTLGLLLLSAYIVQISIGLWPRALHSWASLQTHLVRQQGKGVSK